MNVAYADKVAHAPGFFAALDQSGGSTPKALAVYGVEPDEYDGEREMFDVVHAMRTRIVTSPSFDGRRVLAAILFEDTMDRDIGGRPSPEYLWSVKQVVPFLKVDAGLADEADGVQTMKPIPGLDSLLSRAVAKNIFGTKMRSLIKHADRTGVGAVVDQQFDVAAQITAAGLLAIIEPEVDINSPTKAAAEELLKAAIIEHLAGLADGVQVALKLTIPSVDGFYRELIDHPRVMRVLALSGGYSRADADARLTNNPGMIASFSRALTEGLSVHQSDADFDAQLDTAIASIYAASTH